MIFAGYGMKRFTITHNMGFGCHDQVRGSKKHDADEYYRRPYLRHFPSFVLGDNEMRNIFITKQQKSQPYAGRKQFFYESNKRANNYSNEHFYV
jgi:hypothetical protein